MLHRLRSTTSFRSRKAIDIKEESESVHSSVLNPHRRKRDVFKSYFGYPVPELETSTLISTGTMTDKSISSSIEYKGMSATTGSTGSTKYTEGNQMTLDPQAMDFLGRNTLNVDNVRAQGVDDYRHDSVNSNMSFHTKYDHSFTIDPPPKSLSKSQHGKWERSQMLKHTASKHDLALLKSKRSLIFHGTPKKPLERQYSYTTQASPYTQSMLEAGSNFGPYQSNSPENNSHKVYTRDNHSLANVSTFFKSMGSLFTTSSPTKLREAEPPFEVTLTGGNIFSPSTSIPSFDAKQWPNGPISSENNNFIDNEESFQF